IRDLTVTGVQTCALPIFHHVLEHGDLDRRALSGAHPLQERDEYHLDGNATDSAVGDGDRHVTRLSGSAMKESRDAGSALDDEIRSEERRVGKEWRCRW